MHNNSFFRVNALGFQTPEDNKYVTAKQKQNKLGSHEVKVTFKCLLSFESRSRNNNNCYNNSCYNEKTVAAHDSCYTCVSSRRCGIQS